MEGLTVYHAIDVAMMPLPSRVLLRPDYGRAVRLGDLLRDETGVIRATTPPTKCGNST